LLPNAPDVAGMSRPIDDRPVPLLEAALAEAAGLPEGAFAAWRVPGLAEHPEAAWSRDRPAWCPVCLFEDVAARGEVHARAEWGLGCYLLCGRHGCLLVSECPCCLKRASYSPVNGRLRLWCDKCGNTADDALEPGRIPYWPFGLRQQVWRCRTVSLTGDARQLLLHLQRTRLAALAGQHVPAPWTHRLKRARVTETLRRLCFIMLGPLWEDAERPPLASDEGAGAARLPEDWTPGSLPAFVAAPALLASATFLAAEDDVALAGISWDRQALLDGEKVQISAETLPWHLSAFDAGLALELLSPAAEPFATLLSAIRCDAEGLGPTREAQRRKYGVGYVRQRRRLAAIARQGNHVLQYARLERIQADTPTDRYALDRLIPDFWTRDAVPEKRLSVEAAVAVYAMIGSDGADDDLVHRMGWPGTRMESRYILSWIMQHRDCAPQILVTELVQAVERARAGSRGLVLPDLAPGPIE
jgi:hypothetical protein